MRTEEDLNLILQQQLSSVRQMQQEILEQRSHHETPMSGV